MILSITIQGMRCFKEAFSMPLSPEITLLAGANGSGKSSICEAIHLFTHRSSYRTTHTSSIINTESLSGTAILNLQEEENQQDWQIRLSIEKDEGKSITINDKEVSGAEVKTLLNTLTFTDTEHELIAGYNDVRRSFIDALAVTYNHALKKDIAKYKKLVAQQTSLLKSYNADISYYTTLSAMIQELSLIIRAERKATINRLYTATQSIENYLNIPGYTIEYTESEQVSYETERAAQSVLSGAHRDTMSVISSKGKEKEFFSRGQQKLVSFALKSVYAQYVLQKPTLIFDDFFGSLDENVTEKILSWTNAQRYQVIIAAPGRDIEKKIQNIVGKNYFCNILTT